MFTRADHSCVFSESLTEFFNGFKYLWGAWISTCLLLGVYQLTFVVDFEVAEVTVFVVAVNTLAFQETLEAFESRHRASAVTHENMNTRHNAERREWGAKQLTQVHFTQICWPGGYDAKYDLFAIKQIISVCLLAIISAGSSFCCESLDCVIHTVTNSYVYITGLSVNINIL
ncbi:Hypothetical_protein [Hexamita inflata]|uniref:Hypothetical_protein n=1 Tax=Hexamita inflata TaxID=28002 RepID=A0AA86NZ99_9EUKA|nr:Hypothetical protein HINF_LOCUS15144 [Hexamita inflata]